MKFSKGPMNRDTSESSFSQDTYTEIYPDGIQFQFWNLARKRIVYRKLRALIEVDGPILDIGCGRGIIADYLSAQGMDCWGCDIGKAKPISENIAPKLFLETDAFLLKQEFRNSVRTILLLDVLEHLESPKKFLADCQKAFPNLQQVLITLPARRELWSNFDEYCGHHIRYDFRSLEDLLSEFPGKLVRRGYIFHILYPMMLVGLWLKNKRKTNRRAPNGRLQLILHGLAAKILSADELVLPGRLAGMSIYAAIRL